ncbi:MAG: MFS transporter [Firmicutes bacterium]|nr:MFS transporter [Bacillota bacterium]
MTSLLFICVREEAVERRGASGLVQEWLAGLRLGFRSRLILRILLAACVANFALVPLDIILTAWVKGPMHGGSFLLGVMSGGFAAGAIAGGMVLGAVAERAQLKTILAGGLTALGVCVGAVGLWPNAVWDTSLIVVGGVAVGLLNGSLSALFLSVVPESMRGRMAGALGAFSTFTGPVGVSLFGALMVHLPLSALWFLIGGLVVASGLSFFVPVENDVERVLAGAAAAG